MNEYEEEIAIINSKINEAETVIIGAGSGLSTSAGLLYSGSRFTNNFADFIAKYGYADMYSAAFYPYPSLEEFWAYFSRHILLNRYENKIQEPYPTLLNLVKGKEYFVLTTNVDHKFQAAGFDKKRLFYTQGDYGLFQCSVPCHNKTYDNEEQVRQMVVQQKDMRIPSELIPYCPVCGEPMTTNLRKDNIFVEDEGWHKAAEHYETFLNNHRKSKVVFLELGVGMNTPGIIKYPFMQMTHQWNDAFYVSISKDDAYAPKEIQSKSVCINADIREALLKI